MSSAKAVVVPAMSNEGCSLVFGRVDYIGAAAAFLWPLAALEVVWAVNRFFKNGPIRYFFTLLG